MPSSVIWINYRYTRQCECKQFDRKLIECDVNKQTRVLGCTQHTKYVCVENNIFKWTLTHSSLIHGIMCSKNSFPQCYELFELQKGNRLVNGSIKSADTEIKMTARTTELFHAIKRCNWGSTPGMEGIRDKLTINERQTKLWKYIHYLQSSTGQNPTKTTIMCPHLKIRRFFFTSLSQFMCQIKSDGFYISAMHAFNR